MTNQILKYVLSDDDAYISLDIFDAITNGEWLKTIVRDYPNES